MAERSLIDLQRRIIDETMHLRHEIYERVKDHTREAPYWSKYDKKLTEIENEMRKELYLEH